jgi:hypothetical protein
VEKTGHDLEHGGDRNRKDQSQRSEDRGADDQHEQHHEGIEVDEPPDHQRDDERVFQLT